ncbi:hypothetical protein [Novosphingobium sp. ERW19]|uniref:hypothetical protein n=1 Tax=Novosphingobium sp. ERW19 TaxID=2726186 RepID=UPI0014570C24|nr:hypothetical protein [Novosphingobium sp. ERW19]NLR41456.1 hypothetical protein [Novosphingobium sp. ERW19]
MIDPDWFSTIRCLIGADLGDDEVQRLAKVLGEQEEVLPYLLLKTNAFANWPAARLAFRQAARSAIRPTAWREGTDFADAPADMRESFRTELSSLLRVSDDADGAKALEAMRLFRSFSPSAKDEPHVFIRSE